MNNKDKILIINSLGDQASRYINSIAIILSDRYETIIKPLACRSADSVGIKNDLLCAIFLGPILKNGKGNNILKYLIFLLLLPFLFVYNFAILCLMRQKRGLKKIILVNWNEKLILTAAAKILGLKIFWLELRYFDKNIPPWPQKIIYFLYRLNSKNATIISSSEFIREQLAVRLLARTESVVVNPSIKLHAVEHQENIFESMAKKEYLVKQKKFFTIGTVCRLDENQRIESLFSAISLCLETVPNMQLIVVGEGSEKKNLAWLAKKMGVENVIWFVGGQDKPKKWMLSFDLYILPVSTANMSDFYNVLEAMSAGLPVIAPKNFGLEDLVAENKTGSLIGFDNPEMLARQILKLEQNAGWRRELGKNSKDKVENYFTMEKMSAKLNSIIN